MKWIKSASLGLAMLLAFLFAALSVNQQELALTFGVWETPIALSVFWWLLTAFVFGLLFGLLNGVWISFKQRMKNRKLQQELAQSAAELDRLKSLAMQSTQT